MKALKKTPPGETTRAESEPEDARGWVARAFTFQFVRLVTAGKSLQPSIIDLLDRLLLILMIVEVMYTVQVSFREHALAPEPFLIGRDVWRRRDLLSRAPRR